MATTRGNLTLVTAPTDLPITCEVVKEYGRITDCEDDAAISRLIDAATDVVETHLGRQLMTATYDFIFNKFFPDPIELPRPPLQSVTSITYTDPDGVTQTVATSVYVVDTDNEPGRVYQDFSQSWPSTRGTRNDVTIRFVAGYSSVNTVPEIAKVAIAQMVNQMYDSRNVSTEKSLTETQQFQRLIWALKVPEFV